MNNYTGYTEKPQEQPQEKNTSLQRLHEMGRQVDEHQKPRVYEALHNFPEPDIKLERLSREEAKKYLCSGCTGTRMSGSYFSYKCKGEALECHRVDDFLSGYDAALSKVRRDNGGE